MSGMCIMNGCYEKMLCCIYTYLVIYIVGLLRLKMWESQQLLNRLISAQVSYNNTVIKLISAQDCLFVHGSKALIA